MNSLLCLQLPAQATSPLHARRFLTETLTRWNRLDRLDDALIVLTELVENAIRHATGDCEVRLHREGDALIIAVADASPRLPRAIASEDPLRETGWGLHIVGHLATSWGSQFTDTGKIVSATLADAG